MKHAILAILALCACERRFNPEFCLAHPDDVRCGPPPDAPQPCNDDLDCTGQVCDIAATPPVCVDCTAANATLCDATTPVCATDNQCRACTNDDECPGSVCLPDGTCPAEADIIYASTAVPAPGNCGTRANPCTITEAIVQVSPTRKIVKMLPNAGQAYLVAGGNGLVLNKDVTIIARGTSFGRAGAGSILTVTLGRTVTILGGVIKGGAGTNGHGIICNMLSVLTLIDVDIGPNIVNGINDAACGMFLERVAIHDNDGAGLVKIGGTLEVSRSVFQNNPFGGIDLSGTGTRFTILNSVFWTNGVAAGGVGGIRLDTDTSTTSRLEFNSFNANLAGLGTGAALECNVPGFTARNNVMFGNGDTANVEQVGGNCSHTHSIVSPGAVPVGTGNAAADPMFVAAGSGDLRTMAGSPTEGVGDPASDLTGLAATDIDGDPRTSPPDIGIDEHP